MGKIKNRQELESNNLRKDLLNIVDAGLSAIDTKKIIKKAIRIENEVLHINNEKFPLKDRERIFIIGFGKVSCQATQALEEILKSKLTGGIALSNVAGTCEIVETYKAEHPRPTNKNVDASKKLVELAREVDEKDLVIVVVSGGGSALLCWPASECEQGNQLYDKFLTAGGTIQELNTVRKHISNLKGGGLAKILYPAQVVGLIFSDIPGGNYRDIASGPTYLDNTTIEDAQEIITKYNLGEYDLIETPKNNKWFERVTNLPMISNVDALAAMEKIAEEIGYQAVTVADDLFLSPDETIDKMINHSSKGVVVLAGGETRILIPENTVTGEGGRNTHTAMVALSKIKPNQCFTSIASDGIDNSRAAGAVADKESRDKMISKKIDTERETKKFNSHEAFKRTNDLIQTSATESNVSDFYVLLTEK